MEKLVEELRQTKLTTIRYFDLPEEDLSKSYAKGKWTVRELLHHIVDAETVLYDRVRRVISSKEQPVIWAFDQDAWCKGLDYQSFPLNLNKSIYIAVRTSVEYLVPLHYQQDGEKTFVHSGTGLRSLKEEFDKIAWHNRHHLNQIERAIGPSNASF